MAERGCPQYLEAHGYCTLTEGHEGDCTLDPPARAWLGYSELERGIDQAPSTYLPALLITVVKRCVRDRVFVDGGMQKVVARASLDASSKSRRRADEP